jgi:hypothetical protein
MSSFAAYGRLEKAIAAADTGSIRQRWEYGRRLLVDKTKSTEAENLRNGALDGLVAAARRQGIANVGRREIQHRLQAARLYPGEAHIAYICARYESWGALRTAGFPPVQLPLDADPEPFDPRTREERARDAGQVLDSAEEKAAGQLDLFAYFKDDAFDELSTIAELRKHAVDMRDWTERQAKADDRRLAYVDKLSAAVNGDESKTWADANAALTSRTGAA